jgi:hypothetical protein
MDLFLKTQRQKELRYPTFILILDISVGSLVVVVDSTDEGNPVLGVHVYLYSDDVHEENCLQDSRANPWSKKALCYAISDANGKCAFKFISCVKFMLFLFYKDEKDHFKFSILENFMVLLKTNSLPEIKAIVLKQNN